MNAHDDFMDVRAAYERYERAYTAWGRAVDGKLDEERMTIGPPSPPAIQRRMATIMFKALHDLRVMSREAQDGILYRGWARPRCKKAPKVPKPKKPAKKRARRRSA